MKVYDVRCEEYFAEFCTVMSMKRLQVSNSNNEKNAICIGCKKNSEKLKVKNVIHPELDNRIFQDSDYISLLNDIESMEFGDLFNLKFKLVEIGRIAILETSLHFKKIDLEFENNELAHYRIKLIHAAKSILIAKELFSKLEFRIVFIHSPEYSVGGAFAAYCELQKIKVFNISFSLNMAEKSSSLMIYDWAKYKLLLPQPTLAYSQNYSPSKSSLKRAGRHLSRILEEESPFVFSSRKKGVSTRESFGIPRNNKIALLVMSSYDEVFAMYNSGLSKVKTHEGNVFLNQIEWIKETIKFGSNIENLSLIIRPHPREYGIKRNLIVSKHVHMWEEAIRDLPENVFIDTPEHEFSIYDHLSEVDCIITGWSSVALEGMLSGIPCVTYDSSYVLYPPEIHFTGNTKEEYFANIISALKNGRQDSIIEEATEWFALLTSLGSIRTSGVLKDFYLFKHFPFTRRIADLLSFYFANSIKKFEVRFGHIGKDSVKLKELVSRELDSVFDL